MMGDKEQTLETEDGRERTDGRDREVDRGHRTGDKLQRHETGVIEG
jgi:hypothetical protein